MRMFRVFYPFGLWILCSVLGAEGFLPTSTSFTVTENSSTAIQVDFNLPNYHFENVTIGTTTYSRIVAENAVTTDREGWPELPAYSVTLRIPNTGSVSLDVTDETVSSLTGHIPVPSTGVHLDGEERGITANAAYYEQGGMYPEQAVVVSRPALLRDMRVVTVTVFPFVYEAGQRTLQVRQHCTLRLLANSTPGANELTRTMKPSRAFLPFYQHVANVDRDEPADYQMPCLAVVCPDNASINSYVNQYIDWKRAKGFEVHRLTPNETASASDVKALLQDAYDNWINPPEYIVLIGDVDGFCSIPCFFETITEYHGCTDHPYVQLSGDDILADAFIGRVSIASVGDFQTFLSKMNIYERQVNMSNLTLYHHSLLVADTNPSGISCVYTMDYIHDRIAAVDPSHTFTELYGAGIQPAEMNNAINDGSLFFAYRGYIGMSGWDSENIAALTNINQLTNAVIITCDTSPFNDTANTELLLRAGTSSAPKGAVSAIGMSTPGTHTQFNNILEAGIFYGLYNEDMYDMGSALARGKLALYDAYVNVDYGELEIFSLWCNQIGDPSLQVWRTEPITMNASYAATIPTGQNYLAVTVTDENNSPVANATVALHVANSETTVCALTDAAGMVTLTGIDSTASSLSLTITKADYCPILGTVTHTTQSAAEVTDFTIDDANSGSNSGNNNGEANPAETFSLYPVLRNYGTTTLQNVTATVACSDAYLTLSDNIASFGDLQSGENVVSIDPLRITISPAAPDRHQVDLTLALASNAGVLPPTHLFFEIHGCDLDPIDYAFTDGNDDILQPGETATLNVTLQNHGQCSLSEVQVAASSLNDMISFADSTATYGTIDQNATAGGSGFTVIAATSMIPGITIPIRLHLYNDSGYDEIETLNLTLGQPSVTDPLGPDEDGYLCFDDGDIGYVDCPTYQWIEIDPNHGGTGTDTNLTDLADEDDHIAFFDLPFTFRFYGALYDQVGICTNGFICFSTTQQASFRNWPLPGPQGPSPMIAAMWDDLRTAMGAIYYRYNESTHQFVIEWSNCANAVDNSEETFEIVLYDPMYYPTTSMNGPVKIQYKVFNDVDSNISMGSAQGNYCTVGLEDASETVGLQYVYNNTYMTAAKPITNETALYFTAAETVIDGSYLTMVQTILHDRNANGYAEPGEHIDLGINVCNLGQGTATGVTGVITCANSYVTVLHGYSTFPDIPGNGTDVNRQYFSFVTSSDTPDGELLNFTLQLTDSDDTWTYSFSIRVHRPQLALQSYLLNDSSGNNNGIVDPGETVTFAMNLENSGYTSIHDVTGQLTSASGYAIINTLTFAFGDIPAGANRQGGFNVTVASNAPLGTSVVLTLYVTDSDGVDLSETVCFCVGTAPSGIHEDFSTFLPTGWSIDEHTENWAQVSDTWAGGTTPEVEFFWFPAWTGTSRLISQGMNLIGAHQATVSFRHYFNSFTNEGITIGLAARANNGDWTTLWSTTPSSDIGPETVTLDIPNDLLQLPNLQVCMFLAGNTFNMELWAIDDINVNVTMGNCALVMGHLQLQGGDAEPTQGLITLSPYSVHPAADGSYMLYAAPGNYDELTATLHGYETNAITDIGLSVGDARSYDFDLNYFFPADNLSLSAHDDVIGLQWQYNPSAAQPRALQATRQTAQRQVFQQFQIWRQLDCGAFEFHDSTTATSWQEAADTSRTYRYYIVTQYDDGVSDSTRHVAWNEPVSAHDQNSVPTTTHLLGNFPNPFNPNTRIEFSLAQRGPVRLEVYNLRGQRVRTLLAGDKLEAGKHSVNWDGTNDTHSAVASGVYFYRLQAVNKTEVRKATLLK